jgi:hypothetical protein
MTKKNVLVLAALMEGVLGVGLLIAPSLIGQLLLGADLTGVAGIVARVTGIAVLTLSIACWPGTPLLAMLLYSAAITLYLAYIGFTGGPTGRLLWPAFGLHVVLTAFLARALATEKKTKT